MKFEGNVARFMTHPMATSTSWYADPETDEIVTTCEVCGSEARHSQQQLLRDFKFEHKVGCASSGSTSQRDNLDARNERAYDLLERLAAILEEESEQALRLSVLAFLTAVTVHVTAEEGHASVEDWTTRFSSDLKRNLQAVATGLTDESDELFVGGELIH